MTPKRHSFTPPPDVIMPTAEDLEEIAIEADREAGAVGPSQMIRGGLIFGAGALVTFLTWVAASSGGTGGFYLIAYGAVMGGLADFVIGFSNWRRGKHAQARDNAIIPK